MKKQISDFKDQISDFGKTDFRFQILENLLADFRKGRNQILLLIRFHILIKSAKRIHQNHNPLKSDLRFHISDFGQSESIKSSKI